MSELNTKEISKKSDCERDFCPVRDVISRFSGKWSLLILYILSGVEVMRFNALGRAIPDVSPKVLSDTLKVLEADNLISRNIYAEIPPRVEYSLTEKGRSLMPILNSLLNWAQENRNVEQIQTAQKNGNME